MRGENCFFFCIREQMELQRKLMLDTTFLSPSPPSLVYQKKFYLLLLIARKTKERVIKPINKNINE